MPNGVFALKDCALIAIATGRKAMSLRELREILTDIRADSIYYHFWGGLLQPRFEERELNNDFAGWVWHGLHDAILAERLAVLDPTDHPDLEDLRQALLDVIDERLDESEYLPWMRATRQFEFICSQIVVFDTRRRLHDARELAQLMPQLSLSSIFYHFIDARRRLADGGDDFSFWLAGLDGGYPELRAELKAIDPYFGGLAHLRDQLSAALAPSLEEGA